MYAKASAITSRAKYNIMGLKTPMYVEVSDSTVRTTASSVKASGHFPLCQMSFFCAMSESVVNGARVGRWDIVTRAEHLRFFFVNQTCSHKKCELTVWRGWLTHAYSVHFS